MAFTTSDQKITSANQATALLNDIRTVYNAAKTVQARLNLYTAGTDATFNAAINALFTAAERTELNQMLTQVNALVTDWETNHRSPLGLP